jgi:hypothetical protein
LRPILRQRGCRWLPCLEAGQRRDCDGGAGGRACRRSRGRGRHSKIQFVASGGFRDSIRTAPSRSCRRRMRRRGTAARRRRTSLIDTKSRVCYLTCGRSCGGLAYGNDSAVLSRRRHLRLLAMLSPLPSHTQLAAPRRPWPSPVQAIPSYPPDIAGIIQPPPPVAPRTASARSRREKRRLIAARRLLLPLS